MMKPDINTMMRMRDACYWHAAVAQLRISCTDIALHHALHNSFLCMLLQLSVNAHKLDKPHVKDPKSGMSNSN